MPHTILVVDDDPAIRELVREYLSMPRADALEAPQIVEAETCALALRAFEEHAPDLVMLDMRLPDGDGLDVLAAIRNQADVPVVVITADSSSSRTIRAIQGGAYDYLVKPLEPEPVSHVVERALEHRRLSVEVRSLQEEMAGRDARERIIGASPAMLEVYKLIGRVAASDVPVLITGETGTGKELVAESIHHSSTRRNGPLVRVNCAALPETLLESELFGHEKGSFTGALDRRKGRFELADGGTIFLDEVGELEPTTQKKLLRVLQFGRFERVGGTATIETDARVIAATNIDLERAVAEGTFREDLYYRLHVVRIALPPLRERREDVPSLVAHFLERYRPAPAAPPVKISEAAMNHLLGYPWPGNVRQLENAIRRAVVMSADGVIMPFELDLATGAPHAEAGGAMVGSSAAKSTGDDGPAQGEAPAAGMDPARLLDSGASLDVLLGMLERRLAYAALKRAGGNRAAAAKALGVDEARLAHALGEVGAAETEAQA
jgi:DNA-binding NtrC family response regulator